MCKNRIGQLLALSLLALINTGCGQKGDLFLPEPETTESELEKKDSPEEQDPKDGPIMEAEQQVEQEPVQAKGDQP